MGLSLYLWEIKKCVKKSLEKSKIILEKRKNGRAKILHKNRTRLQ